MATREPITENACYDASSCVCLRVLSRFAVEFAFCLARQEARRERRVSRIIQLPFGVARWRRSIFAATRWRASFALSFGNNSEEEGVNFAGHYTLASAGCGTGCSITAIVDARNGKAYFPNEFNGWTSIVGDYEIPEGEEQWTFRAESRLLRAIGRPHIGKPNEERYGPSGIYYYEWKNNRLRLVKFTPVGSYPEADPPGKSDSWFQS